MIASIAKKIRGRITGKLATLISLIAAFSFVFLLIVSLDRFSQASGPRLELESTCTLDLGKGKAGQTLTGSFKLRNTGISDLIYAVMGSCACTTLSPRQGKISPGGVDTINLGIRLTQEGKTEHVAVNITSNDPDRPTAVYRVTAKCPAPLTVSPTHINFGYVVEGEERQITLKIYDSDGKPINSKQHLIATSTTPHMFVNIVSIANGEKQIEVALPKTAPKGAVNAAVIIQVGESGRKLEVPVIAEIVGPVLISPPTLFLARDHSGNYKEACFLVSALNGKPLGLVRSIKKVPHLTVTEKPSNTSQHKVFIVNADKEFLAPARLEISAKSGDVDGVIDIMPGS